MLPLGVAHGEDSGRDPVTLISLLKANSRRYVTAGLALCPHIGSLAKVLNVEMHRTSIIIKVTVKDMNTLYCVCINEHLIV